MLSDNLVNLSKIANSQIPTLENLSISALSFDLTEILQLNIHQTHIFNI